MSIDITISKCLHIFVTKIFLKMSCLQLYLLKSKDHLCGNNNVWEQRDDL